MANNVPVKESTKDSKQVEKTSLLTNVQKSVLGGLLAILVLLFGAYTYVYGSTPENIKKPKLEHAHLRIQYFVDGQSVNFGADEFQQEYKKGQCSAEFPKQPIHFHDNQDQYVHLHWKDVTGSQLLGYYGNSVGGVKGSLGNKQNSIADWENIPIHVDSLPDSVADTTWVYNMVEGKLVQREINDFLDQDLETFFGNESSFNSPETSFIDRFFPVAHAQKMPDESELKRIQNLIGDVVIFVQDSEPTQAQVSAAETSFIQLEDSVCGG